MALPREGFQMIMAKDIIKKVKMRNVTIVDEFIEEKLMPVFLKGHVQVTVSEFIVFHYFNSVEMPRSLLIENFNKRGFNIEFSIPYPNAPHGHGVYIIEIPLSS
jgi:ribosomal protein S19